MKYSYKIKITLVVSLFSRENNFNSHGGAVVITYAGGWPLRRPFTFNLLYSDLLRKENFHLE